jgi:hypothetical protein
MAKKEKTLVEHAKDLAEALQEYGSEVSYLDILDDLACLGLTLVPAVGTNHASDAYFEEIKNLVSSE